MSNLDSRPLTTEEVRRSVDEAKVAFTDFRIHLADALTQTPPERRSDLFELVMRDVSLVDLPECRYLLEGAVFGAVADVVGGGGR